MSFLGFTSTRLGSEVSCPRTFPEKSRGSSVAKTQDPWIKSQTLYHWATQDLNSTWNTIIWRNLKEDHLRNIPVKFGKNPVNRFWEVLCRKSLRTHPRTTQRYDNSLLTFGQWSWKWYLFLSLAILLLTPIRKKSFENMVEIRKNGGKQHFLLFHHVFHPKTFPIILQP